jgi:branched-chain amino acid aminotransferase
LPLSGINVCVSSWTRNSDNSIPSRAKVNGGYANVSLMKNEAIMNGYDDAIALDSNGSVTEGTVANLFIIRNGNLITPTVNSDILEGITRDSIIRIARDMKLSVIERTVNRSELYISDEAFICGSSARITPILSIDKRVLGNGKIGSITSKLKDKYSDVQKGNIKDYADWRKDCTF